jgi:hypothetical protein
LDDISGQVGFCFKPVLSSLGESLFWLRLIDVSTVGVISLEKNYGVFN